MTMDDRQLDEASLSGTSPEEATDADPQASGTRKGFVVNDHRFWTLSDEALQAEEHRPQQPSFIEQLQQSLDQKDKQLREYIAAYKREVGEGLEKTKQRLERDSTARVEQQRGQLALPMLEVLDALERSIGAGEKAPGDGAALLQGIKRVHLLMVQKLQDLGLTRLQTVGQPFDPTRHEAVAVRAVSDAAQDNLVVAEIMPGFALGERVLRAAQVMVAKLQA
jgi:molecular chaperone GrpE